MNLSSTNLSLEGAIKRRDSLMQECLEDLRTLRKEYQKGPEQIKTESIQFHLTEIGRINALIEQRKEEALEKKKYHCLGNRTIRISTWACISLNIIAWLAVGAYSVYDLSTTSDSKQKNKSLTEIVLTIIALFITGVVADSIKAVDEDKRQFELLAKISKVEKQGEENFRVFLNAFNDYKKSEEDKQKKLSNCIHQLDKIPCGGVLLEEPSRDQWVSLMIQMLPDDNPIKIKLLRLRDAAVEICEGKKSEEKNEHPARLKEENISDSGNESIKERQNSSNEFEGEQMEPPSWITDPKGKGRLKKKLFSHSKESSLNLGENYRNGWKKIEQKLFVRLDCIQIEKLWFDRYGNVSENLRDLPTSDLSPLPVLIDNESMV